MNILMIGGSGVLSRDILEHSVKIGHDVTVLNRGNHRIELPVKAIIANIRNVEDVLEKIDCQFFDVVIDFVSYNPEQLKKTFSIFEDRCKQYIFISSCCVYRRDDIDFPIKEDSPKPNIHLPYGINKYECEQFLQQTKHRCYYTIVRPYITYGDTRIPFALAPLARLHGSLIKRIQNNKPLFIWKENNRIPVCTLTHTRDFAVGFCGLFLNELAFDNDVNIVGDEICSWNEMIKIIYQELGKPNLPIPEVSLKDICNQFPNDSQFFRGDRNLNAVFDNSKIKKLVPEFESKISLKEGIKDTINYYVNNNYLDGFDYKYDAKLDRLLRRNGVRGLRFYKYSKKTSIYHRIEYFLYSTFSFYRAQGLEFRIKKLLKFLNLND